MDLTATLHRAFPFARIITVTRGPDVDGAFVAEFVLPVRNGESTVQVYRFPGGTRPALDDQLRWAAAHQRMSAGHGRWSFFIAWDGTASSEEIIELVARRVIKHPALGDPGYDDVDSPPGRGDPPHHLG